jgi:hypothetical protein
MSRYYRELHDRELLSQAESMLNELHRRRLLDVRVPSKPHSNSAEHFRCPIDSVIRTGNALSIVVDRTYEPTANVWPDKKADAASGGDRR